MSESTTNAMTPKIVPENEGQPFPSPGYLVLGKISSFETNEQFGMFSCDIEPGAGPPMHMHTFEDEAFYILEGEVEFTIGDDVQIAKPGMTVFAPRGIKHRFRGHGDRNSKMVGFVTGSNFEKFYARYEAAINQPEPNIEEIIRIASEHGLTMFPDEP